MKKSVFLLLLGMSVLAKGQSGSEIYLFDVKLTKDKISVANGVNVTNHPGYDNQPYFNPSKPILYYASFNEDGRSDLKMYNLNTKETSKLTSTNEREYSPTVTPDGKFVSCIIQRDNGAQDLGKYPLDGGKAATLIDNLIVGYHAWVDSDNLILFVLGEPMTLRWYNLKTKEDRILAENAGRSLHQIPGQKAMSFVIKESDNYWTINRLDVKTKEVTTIAGTLPGREDLTWSEDGRIIMSDGENLFFLNPKGNSEWQEISMDKRDKPLKGITRLAISKDGNKLALVASE